nr:hypothetical protein [Mycoplasmopsis bovis]
MYILRRAGRQVLVGVPPKDENEKNRISFINFRNNFRGTACFRIGCWHSDQDTKEALILGTKGIVYKIGRIISLDEVKDVFEQLAKGELIGRAVIDFRSYK